MIRAIPWLLGLERAPWCWCGHDAELHRHDRHATDCSQCGCPRLATPLIRRRR